jgi:hypothetical protein
MQISIYLDYLIYINYIIYIGSDIMAQTEFNELRIPYRDLLNHKNKFYILNKNNCEI